MFVSSFISDATEKAFKDETNSGPGQAAARNFCKILPGYYGVDAFMDCSKMARGYS